MSTISSRVAVAAHVLTLLSHRRDEPLSSECVAASVNTNAVVVRRIVGALRNAGLVTVHPGVRGGAVLNRPPDEITLLDVYRAVEEKEDLFSLHPQTPRKDCSVGGHITDVLIDVFGQARGAMEAVLGGVTIRQVHEATLRHAQEDCPVAAKRAAHITPAHAG